MITNRIRGEGRALGWGMWPPDVFIFTPCAGTIAPAFCEVAMSNFGRLLVIFVCL